MAPINTSGTSFKEYTATSAPRRIIMSLEGLERQGKTHFALSAPGPLAYLQMDPGGEDVLPKIKRLDPRKQLLHAAYYVDVKPGLSPQQIAQIADRIWLRTTQDYEAALARARTLVIDTASEWFTCLRLARFGKLTQVMPEDYGPVYAEFRRLLRLPYNHDCNVIFIHKLKAEYQEVEEKSVTGKRKPARRTGGLVRDGFKGLGFEVQLEARAQRGEGGEFELEIRNCRQNPDVEGMVLPQAMCSFADLASVVYPETEPGDWA